MRPGEVNLGQYYFGAGLRAYSAGKLADAAEDFRKSLEHDPGNEWVKKSLERTEGELKLQAATAPLTPSLPRSPEIPASRPEPAPLGVPAPVETPAPVEAAQAPSAPSTGGQTYVVRRGDRLWSIAQKVYGDGFKWTLIEGANPQIKGSQLEAGATLVIPPVPAELQTASERALHTAAPMEMPSPRPAPPARENAPIGAARPAARGDFAMRHTVKPGETLYRISLRYYGKPRWDLILSANPQLQQNPALEKGMVLVIPPLPAQER